MPETFLGMPEITRRGFVKGSAVAAGTAVVASTFLFKTLDGVAVAESVAAQGAVEDFIATTCWIGKQDCGMIARRIDGRVVKFEGNPTNPRNVGTLCPKGHAQIQAVYDPNRVKWPLIRTNEKGVTGEWRRASWDEALDLVAEKVNEVRARNPKLVLWQKGRSKAKDFYDDAFVKSIGATKIGHGAFCSDAGYRALEYTLGPHAVLHPDFRYCDYMLSWGWNITGAGGNKFCWLTWPRHMVKARERGMKITHLDPRLRSAGPFADTWLPIRPGTDLAMAMALCRELIAHGYLDRPYLTTYTNAPMLVKSDGMILKTTVGEGEEAEEIGLVWDEASGAAVPFGDAESPALEGEFEVEGEKVKPGFQLFIEHVDAYTPEFAAEITGLTADQIRRVADEFGSHAKIGATIVVDGVEVPYRPVGIMAYHMTQQDLGFQTARAITMVPMLVGAVGAAGGQMVDFTWKIHKNYAKFEKIKVEDPPYDFQLKNSKYFPINTGHPGIVAQTMIDPDRWGVEEIPEVAILHMVNPLASFPSRPEYLKSYMKFKFVVDINPWLSETADYFADVVLPAATIEKYEGPTSATDQYIDAVTMRIPPMEPMFESRGEIDIYMDLTERMGVLYGEGGYLSIVNKELKLTGTEFELPLDQKPEVRHIFDQWAKGQGIEEGVAYFEDPNHGVYIKGPMKPAEIYGYVTEVPFGGVIHRLYGESLLDAQRQMIEKGAEKIYWQDYTAFPTWRPQTMDSSPSEYEFVLLSYHQIEHKQTRTSFIPMLAELAPGAPLDMNPASAARLGLREGDTVTVESHNAITGETRRLTTSLTLIESIRPDTVAMPHHFGMWTHPQNEGQGPSANEIYFTGEGYTSSTADQTFHVKVKVTKGGDA
ncbi:MAG: molybdopterin-dependent oxidoreductase [Actinomycetota bacterium]|nr:molybdopterin-dependent oxidoreductase [Actinomycetota bacterium]